jgi:hypothetical protein
MTAAEEIQDHQARCQPYLLTLRMLARDEGEPTRAAAEIDRATSAIIDEAWAASGAALADGNRRHPGGGTFLHVRLERLTKAAAEAAAAAREGDTARLRHYLRRFEAVTSAIWTAEHAVCGQSDRVSPNRERAQGVFSPSQGLVEAAEFLRGQAWPTVAWPSIEGRR